MQFRLVYDGPLLSTQNEPRGGQPDKKSIHKHDIRRAFHAQLKYLWETHPVLKSRGVPTGFPEGNVFFPKTLTQAAAEIANESNAKSVSLKKILQSLYRQNDFEFVPLVNSVLNLHCDLDVLFLRRDPPGSVIKAGDLDNRLKTLIDALRKPKYPTEFAQIGKPNEGETPFYCLLEDDEMVSSFSVTSDALLDPHSEDENDARRARVVITAKISSYKTNLFNLHMLGG